MVTVKELREQAKKEGIVGYSKMNKAELCRVVKKNYPNCEKGARKPAKKKSPSKKKTPPKKSPLKKKSPHKKSSHKKSPVNKTPTKIYNLKLILKDVKEPFIMEIDEVRIPGNQKFVDMAFKNGQFSKVKKLEIIPSKSKDNLHILPKEIEKFTNLTSLDLRGHPNLRTLPKEIGKLKNLKLINLDYTGINSLPKELASLPNLKFLYILHTELKSLPEEFFKPNAMPSLTPVRRKALEKYRPKYLMSR